MNEKEKEIEELLKYNDYELLYYAEEVSFDDAYEILEQKYRKLIYSRIKKYCVPRCYRDDYYQEGCLMLVSAMRTFDSDLNVPFTTYFEVILVRRIINLIRKDARLVFNVDYLSDEAIDLIREENTISYLDEVKYDDCLLTKMEEDIYEMCFILGMKNSLVASKLNMSSRQIINAKQRVIKKIKSKLKIE